MKCGHIRLIMRQWKNISENFLQTLGFDCMRQSKRKVYVDIDAKVFVSRYTGCSIFHGQVFYQSILTIFIWSLNEVSWAKVKVIKIICKCQRVLELDKNRGRVQSMSLTPLSDFLCRLQIFINHYDSLLTEEKLQIRFQIILPFFSVWRRDVHSFLVYR